MTCWYELTPIPRERAGIAYKEFCEAPIWNVPFTRLAGGGANVPIVRTPDAVLEARPLLEYIDARGRDAQIPAPIGALLPEPNLCRASGCFRRVMYEGSFPDRLVVEFGDTQ